MTPRDDVERVCAMCDRTGYRQFDPVKGTALYRCRNYESCRERQREKARKVNRVTIIGQPTPTVPNPAPAPYDPWPDMVEASRKLDKLLMDNLAKDIAKPIDVEVLRGHTPSPAQAEPAVPTALPARVPPGVELTARCDDCSRTFISSGARLAEQIEQHEENKPGHVVVRA